MKSRLILFLVLCFAALPTQAAISCSNAGVGANATSVSSLATGSYTPGANVLQILVVVNHKSGGNGIGDIPTASGDNLTWVQIDTTILPNTTNHARLTTFRALGASPSTGTVTADFGGVTQDNVNVGIASCSGTDTSGTNGSGAIVQHLTNTGSTTTSCTVTLAAFSNVNNSTFGAFGVNSNATLTVGSGFTILNNGTSSTVIRGTGEWKLANDTTVDATTVANHEWACHGMELKIAGTAVPPKRRVIIQ